VDQGFWKEDRQENVNKKDVRPYNRIKGGVCTKEREEVREFIQKQIRKEYICLSKSSQMALVFFVRKKDRKKRMV